MRKFIALFLFTLIQNAQAQGLTDILFNRSASFEERQSVSKKLQGQGRNQPLEVEDAIAELCYGVDLCAQLTTDFSQCDDADADDPMPECQPKHFREKYNCSEDVTKQSAANVAMAKAILSDMSSLYDSLTEDYFLDAFSKLYQVNFRSLAKDPKAMKEFERKNPHIMEHIKIIYAENLAMGAYTMDCYSRLNPILYQSDKKSMQRYYNFFKAVINTMSFYPEFKKMVNRGASLPRSVLDEHHKVGNVVCYQGYTSTAVHNPETDFGSHPTNGFLQGKCTQRLYISYSDTARGGKLISAASAFKHEDEVLFEPGACFRIDKVYPRTDEAPEDEEDDDEEECEPGERYNFEMTLVR